MRYGHLFNRTRRSAEELAHATPDTYAELLDALDVTSVHEPPPGVTVSIVPASATTSMMGEHVSDALFLPSSLFIADAGVVVDMAYKPAETTLLTLAKTVAAGRWHSAMGIEVRLEQGYRLSELWTEGGAPRSMIQYPGQFLVAYEASAQAVSARVKLDPAQSRK